MRDRNIEEEMIRRERGREWERIGKERDRSGKREFRGETSKEIFVISYASGSVTLIYLYLSVIVLNV